MEWLVINDGLKEPSWNSSLQNALNALSSSSSFNMEIESHFIAIRQFFKEQFSDEEILIILRKASSTCTGRGN